MISSLLNTLLSTSAQAAVLVILILLIKKCFGRFLTPHWHSAIWLILIGRLLLVSGPESHFSIGNFLPSLELSDSSFTLGKTITGYLPTADQTDVNGRKPAQVVDHAGAFPNFRFPLDMRHLLFGVWLLGALVVFLVIMRNIIQILSVVRRAKMIDDHSLLDSFSDCKLELGIKANIRLLASDEVDTPTVTGLFRPTVLLPDKILGHYSASELKLIFVHELIHLKRRDLFIGFVAAMLQTVHWFNPLIWYGFYRMRVDREVACDDAVINHVGSQQTATYCRTLLNLAEIASSRRQTIGTIGIIEVQSETGKRIVMLSRTRKSSRLQLFAGSMIAVFLIGICYTKAQSQPASKSSEAVDGTGISSPTLLSAKHREAGEKTDTLNASFPIAGARPFTLTVDEKIGKLLYYFDENTKKLSSIEGSHGVHFIDDITTISCDSLNYYTVDNKLIGNGPGLKIELGDLSISSDKMNYNIGQNSMEFEGNAKISQTDSKGQRTETLGNKIRITNVNTAPRMRITSGN